MILQKIIAQSSDTDFADAFNDVYIDTLGIGAELKPLDPFYSHGVMYFNNHWYFTLKKVGGSPENRGTRVYKIDTDLNVVQTYDVPSDAGISSSFDSHYHGVLDVNHETGHIYMSREKGKNSTSTGDGHNTDLLLYKTTTPEDITTLTLISTVTGIYSYPILWYRNSTILLGARGDTSANLDNWKIHISTDDGANFNSYDVLETGLNLDGRAYAHNLPNDDGNDIYLAHNPRNDTLSAFESCFLLKSTDGITWTNIQETFSKNISSASEITQAELEANFLVWDKFSDSYALNYEGGNFKSGKANILLSQSLIDPETVAGNTYQTYTDLRFYTYDNGWTYTDISHLLPTNYRHIWARERTVQLTNDGVFDYIIVIDKTGVDDVVKQYKSKNGFVSYTESTIDTLTGNYYFGSHSFNSMSASQRLLILFDVQGEIDDFNDSSNLRLYTPS